MKTSKKIANRLALNTETLRTLAGKELDLAQGGAGQQTNETGCTRLGGCGSPPPPPPVRSRFFDTMTNCL